MPKNQSDITANEAMQMAIQLCTREEKCKFDIEQKLKKYHLSDDIIFSIIESLEKERFIDELRYARSFANDKLKFNKWGRIKIEIALKQKKIPEAVIQQAMQEIDTNEYREILKYELLKKKRTLIKLTDTYTVKHKLFQFAMQRGFESDLINEVISDLVD